MGNKVYIGGNKRKKIKEREQDAHWRFKLATSNVATALVKDSLK